MTDTRYHQLFFAHMQRPRKTDPKPSRPADRRTYGQRLPPLTIPSRHCIGGTQLRLFDMARDYTRAVLPERVDRRYFHFESDNPWLNWAFHTAQDLAERRGWSPLALREVNVGLVIVLSTNKHGEAVRHSELFPALRSRRIPVERTTAVLAAIGLLDDDRVPTQDRWLERKVALLAPGIRDDVTAWHLRLRDGGPRSRPRAPESVRSYLRTLLPALTAWSQRYSHLREVSTEDLLDLFNGADGTSPLQGNKQGRTRTALRSLFGHCKRTGTIFRDPTTKLPKGIWSYRTLIPLQPDDITDAVSKVNDTSTPLPRLVLTLAAVHAARTGDIRTLQLDNVDLGNRRITIAGLTRPVDDLTYQAIRDWLDYRTKLWPRSTNPHLIISRQTAMKTSPVTSSWLNQPVRGLTATIERLRQDRQLDEALVRGFDPLHLAAVFGVTAPTAIRYAAAARELLQAESADAEAADTACEGSDGV